MLALGGHPNKIARSEVAPLISIFKALNQHGRVVKTALDASALEYWVQRPRTVAAFRGLAGDIQAVIQAHSRGSRSLDIMQFLTRAQQLSTKMS